jgi:hypothetical protein
MVSFLNIFSFGVVYIAYLFYRNPDILITLLPQYYDGYFVHYMYPKNALNKGAKTIPILSKIIPKDFSTLGSLKDIFDPHGYPVHVKNVVNVDQDRIMNIMTRGNKGKNMRLFSYHNFTSPHISPSCFSFRANHLASFDEFATNHLFKNVSHNHSFLYAGFESITDADTVKEVVGADIEVMGDYRQNNLFTSNFPREIFTAAMHCAPIDSVSIQLIGTKTWYFVSPDDLSNLNAVPVPTSFNLPMTDDELLEKVKNIYIVKQGPGEALYFGPHWCHAVSTAEGPNLMLNIRYNALDLIKKGPKKLLTKMMIRKYTGRIMGGLPQDNTKLFPILYDSLTNYYDQGCGESNFTAIWEASKTM